MKLYPELSATVQELEQEYNQIPENRKQQLQQLARYVRQKQASGQPAQLNFICTHNSRRSHMAQLWALAAAAQHDVGPVACFSGGTEATAFNPNAVEAMRQLGFRIEKTDEGANPVYSIRYAPELPAARVWSKEVTDAVNPSSNFAAIMTCSDADENCPVIPGAEIRIPLTYEDPKAFDGTAEQQAKYVERARQIGRELLYAFQTVSS
ncbi:protein-tyrosine-phosphatase [Pontibacter sp. E15-1]|uniref:protein-tyrosine-phosphatase n=1 Tax=Pontibacter sp. E15-1 TaxID=2919918 RepID=UPI001F4FE9D1|nr:protein-tyrosine-phosphatase [Pontibacter sp. E15-1]MCJ8163445.1 protein-tyrosine-phosphatase [Pontibacter sp. E15-1]